MITAKALNNVARNFQEQVVNVLINEVVTVENFMLEEVHGNQYVLEFTVPPNIKEITKLCLLNKNNEKLTENKLYVPIETDTKFKYTLTMRAG